MNPSHLHPVSVNRRLIASFIDLLILGIACFITSVVVYFSGWERSPGEDYYSMPMSIGIMFTLTYAQFDMRMTLGKWMCDIAVFQEKKGAWRRAARCLIKWIPLFLIMYYLSFGWVFRRDEIMVIIWKWAAWVCGLVFMVDFYLLHVGHELIHDRMAGTLVRYYGRNRKKEPRGFEVIVNEKNDHQ